MVMRLFLVYALVELAVVIALASTIGIGWTLLVVAGTFVLGKPKGEPVEAVARNLPKSETRRVFNMVTRRYWWHAWWWIPQAKLRGGVDKVHAAIEVEAAPEGRSGATGGSST